MSGDPLFWDKVVGAGLLLLVLSAPRLVRAWREWHERRRPIPIRIGGFVTMETMQRAEAIGQMAKGLPPSWCPHCGSARFGPLPDVDLFGCRGCLRTLDLAAYRNGSPPKEMYN